MQIFYHVDKILDTTSDLSEFKVEAQWEEVSWSHPVSTSSDDFNSLLNLIDSGKIFNQKIILLTSIQSEYEILLRRFSPNINEILDIKDNQISLIKVMSAQ